MGTEGAGGSRVEVPPGAASDLSCQRSGAEGPPPAGGAVALGSVELFSQPPAVSGMPTLPSGPLASPSWAGGSRAWREGQVPGGVPASREKVPGGRVGPGRWQCFGGSALRGRVALTWVMRRSAPVFSSSLKMMSGL